MTQVPMRLHRRSVVHPVGRIPIDRIPIDRIPVRRIAARVAFIVARALLMTGLIGLLTAALANNTHP